MGKLNQIDKAAANKGKGMETLWQFIKFIVVSLGAFVIQTCLPYLIKLPMSEEFLQRPYEFWIYSSAAAEKAGMVNESKKGLFFALEPEAASYYCANEMNVDDNLFNYPYLNPRIDKIEN